MTFLGAAALGLVIHEGVRRRVSARTAVGLAVSAALVTAAPALVILVGIGWTVRFLRIRRNRRIETRTVTPDRVGQVMYIALSAGLGVAAALDLAAAEAAPAEAAEVRKVLRHARQQGLAASLAAAEGTVGPLFAVLARAQLTGSPALEAVGSFVAEQRRDRRARSAEAAQRLPVKLTVPLALLILPGFILLTVGPTVVGTVQRLLGPLLS